MTFKIGDLVEVETKFIGVKQGLIIDDSIEGSYLIQSSNHPRPIIALPQDMQLVSHAACKSKPAVV